MNYNYHKLRRRIKKYYGAVYKFADALGMSSVALYKKLNGVWSWRQHEITLCCGLLNIEKSEIGDYFFTQEV